MGLVVFATYPHKEIGLSDNLQAVPGRLYYMQPGHYNTEYLYDRSTNIGGALAMAINELETSPNRRSTAKRVIVLMSDGEPNEGGDGLSAKDYAKAQAAAAADKGMIVYVISVGYSITPTARRFMQELAVKGHGLEDYAGGDPEEYTEKLKQIFRSLGGRRPVVLIE